MPFVCHIEVTNVCNFKCEFYASSDCRDDCICKKKNVAKKLILYISGSKLTPKLSRKIVDAGIDIILISIEHITSEGYELFMFL